MTGSPVLTTSLILSFVTKSDDGKWRDHGVQFCLAAWSGTRSPQRIKPTFDEGEELLSSPATGSCDGVAWSRRTESSWSDRSSAPKSPSKHRSDFPARWSHTRACAK